MVDQKQPSALELLATPEGVKSAATLIDLGWKALHRFPRSVSFLAGAALAAALIGYTRQPANPGA